MQGLVNRLRHAGVLMGMLVLSASGACLDSMEGSDAPVETSDDAAVTCAEVANACHDVDHGDGPSHACHELGHTGDEEACAAEGAECLVLCSATHEPGTEKEEEEEHGEHEPEESETP